jgi:hypothetical protein
VAAFLRSDSTDDFQAALALVEEDRDSDRGKDADDDDDDEELDQGEALFVVLALETARVRERR